MEELFQVLSSHARIKKNKPHKVASKSKEGTFLNENQSREGEHQVVVPRIADIASSTFSDEKKQMIHQEQIAHFRKSLRIRINKKDSSIPDPVGSFSDLKCPDWWVEITHDNACPRSFERLYHSILSNIEKGLWKDPTSIQMQAIPSLVARRDVIGSAPTGSGKSGAFICPTLLLTLVNEDVFYGDRDSQIPAATDSNMTKKQNGRKRRRSPRALILAPSFELATQLHREVERLSRGLHYRSCALSKSNSSQVASGEVGGNQGLHCLIATPLRLINCIENGLQLNNVRVVVLDEADRLLDAADGVSPALVSGSSHSKTFLDQMDTILSEIPSTAVRALFSATVTPTVRFLAESVLRNPVDISILASSPGGANPDIDQKLVFVGREQGKLLAIRQMVAKGELQPPVLIFCQSQDRAQAVFEELLYDRLHVDVLHAGRSKAARENAVSKFREGKTWILICTDLVARGIDFRAVNMVINYDLPESSVTYIHRIGRCGRAGRAGRALTFCTEVDFDHMRTIANVIKQSGCDVEDWILNLRKSTRKEDQEYARRKRSRHKNGQSKFSKIRKKSINESCED